MVKYTPRYDWIHCVFYSNYLPVNMGLTAFQTLDEGQKKFRVAATGIVTGFSNSYSVKKKLKLVGEPFKIFKNTAFIKGLFNSYLEVNKFIGAKIKTVSGIRGQIKKAVKDKEEGSFRAAFEDKVIMSDVVFLRTWYSINMEKYYNPIVSLDTQRLMKTTWQLRKKLGIHNEAGDYQYPTLERPTKRFSSMRVPKKIAEELPFKTKEKKTLIDHQRQVFKTENKLVKSLSTDKEKEARYFIQRLKLIEKERKKSDKTRSDAKREWKEKWSAGMNKDAILKKKIQMKQRYKEMGLKKARKDRQE